jgi:hypothetical protein
MRPDQQGSTANRAVEANLASVVTRDGHLFHFDYEVRKTLITAFATARNGFELLVVQFDGVVALWVDPAIAHGLLL